MAAHLCDNSVCPSPTLSCDSVLMTRVVAVENLVPYSLSQPAIFKTDGLLPVKHLKLLVRDYPVWGPKTSSDGSA